jgi:hypothetical protein
MEYSATRGTPIIAGITPKSGFSGHVKVERRVITRQ